MAEARDKAAIAKDVFAVVRDCGAPVLLVVLLLCAKH